MYHETYGPAPYYGHSSFYCPYYRQSSSYCPYCYPELYVCPYLNQTRFPDPLIKYFNPEKPLSEQPIGKPYKPPEVLDIDKAVRKTIQAKYTSLKAAPQKLGKAVSGVEDIGNAYRIRYEKGAIYTQKINGPAYVLYGDTSNKYFQMGHFGSRLGSPIKDDEELKYGEGRVAHFEKGEIYWWQDTGPIEFDQIVLTYKGIHCFGETDGPGSDDDYAIIGVTAATGNPDEPTVASTVQTRLYEDVVNRETVPDHIELYRGKPYGLTISFLLLEHDQGDPKKYYAAVKKSVEKGAEVLASYLTGPVALVAGPVLEAVVPAVTDGINSLLGTGDDVIGNVTMPLKTKELVLMATRTKESTIGGIRYKKETPLLSGHGGSYKGYFTFDRA